MHPALTLRLEKLIPLLASDKPGEIVAAAAAIQRTLKSQGRDLHDLAKSVDGRTEGAIIANFRGMGGYAREVMGSIDLDPASCSLAQETVRATNWVDKKQNGLVQEWTGKVFLNPPYSIKHSFIEKLCLSVKRGTVPEAILLTSNWTDTEWWHMACQHASTICFVLGRITSWMKTELKREARLTVNVSSISVRTRIGL